MPRYSQEWSLLLVTYIKNFSLKLLMKIEGILRNLSNDIITVLVENVGYKDLSSEIWR